MTHALYTPPAQSAAREREAHEDWTGAAALWRTAASECPPEASRERGYCAAQAASCERLAAKVTPRVATDREALDAIARAVWPGKGERFTYSVEFIIAEVHRLQVKCCERDRPPTCHGSGDHHDGFGHDVGTNRHCAECVEYAKRAEAMRA